MPRQRFILNCLLGAIVAIAGGFWSAQSLGETRALVIGIDQYKYVKRLRGAVADARDIEAALRGRGVTEIVTLLDADATRDRVLRAFDELVQEAQSGELAIVAFSGHGAQERWGRVRPPNASGVHNVFILAGMAIPDSSGRLPQSILEAGSERIFSSEIAKRLVALHKKGVRTIFVADTCFGGGLTRSLLLSGHEQTSRELPVFGFSDGEDPLESVIRGLPAPINSDTEIPSLTFLAAVDDNHTAPEVSIPRGGESMRGALSYAFARLIDGTAPASLGGWVTRRAVFEYLKPTIRISSDNSQIPDLRPRADFDKVVIDVARDLPRSVPVPPAENISTTVTVFVDGGSVAPFKNDRIELRPVTSESGADLIYKGPDCKVYSGTGRDLIASPVRAEDLVSVAEREVALRRLASIMRPRPREMFLQDGDKRYFLGDMVVVDARLQPPGADERLYYALIDINGNGTVQFLYPYESDPTFLPQDKPLMGLGAAEPFGADTMVLIVDTRPFPELVAGLKALHGRKAPLAAATLIARSVTPNMRIGLQGIYTAPNGPSRC